jgi:hypothetical protein
MGKFVLVIALSGLFAVAAHCQESAQPPLTKTIDIKAVYMFEAIEQLASDYKTVIGFVDDEPVHKSTLLTFHLDDATLPAAMDQLTKADPAYAWRFEPDGAVNVYSRTSTFSLPDIVIPAFTVKQVNRQEFSEALNRVPEIIEWLAQNGCVRSDSIATIGNPPPDNRKATLDETGTTLSRLLDDAAMHMGFHYWSISRNVTPDGCTVGIVLEPVGGLGPR